MKYIGSKARYAKEILEAICADMQLSEMPLNPLQYWVEPFVGGANMIDAVGHLFINRIGNDINVHLISMFQAVQQGWLPPTDITAEMYATLKQKSVSKTVINDSPRIAFGGIGCSYSGRWFGGYARGGMSKGIPRNYARESRNNLLKQKDALRGVQFVSGDYAKLSMPPQSIIYCDPPYARTSTHNNTSFDHTRFWQWCDAQIAQGHKVYVSEYTAPMGWKCIWQKDVCSSLTKHTGSKRAVERLFTK